MNKDYQNYTENLPQIKEYLTSGKTQLCLNEVKKYIPGYSPKYDLLILLITGYNRIKEDKIKGTLSFDEENRELNKLTDRILNFLNQISAKDYEKPNKEESSDPRIGKVKYSIPQKMQMNEETECAVWIAFDEATILKEVGETEGDIKDIRVSKVMGVELICHGKGDAFKIETYDDSEQIIEKDLATSWAFYVTPLKSGKHPLILKISVIIAVDGEKINKTKVLREIVQITTEKPDIQEGQIKEKEAKGFFLMAAAGSGAKGTGGISTPNNPTSTGSNTDTLGKKIKKYLPAIIAILGIGLASIWFMNKFDFGKKEISKEELELKWEEIKESADTLKIQDFIEKNPDSQFLSEAMELLDQLKIPNNQDQSINTETTNPSSVSPEQQRVGNADNSSPDKEELEPKVIEPEPEESDTTTNNSNPLDGKEAENETSNPETDDSVSYTNVSQKPLYRNCEKRKKSKQNKCTEEAIGAFVYKRLVNTNVRLDGKVLVGFIIEKNGKVGAVTVLEENNSKLARKAKEIIQQMPRFTPGQNANGTPVPVLYRLPIKIKG
ncbi:MAG: energy transducer TonB [Bacteroidetes bacterium]|jgi:hypothetical protein|nr:energy transducer TonB [Bacteroidota bacterium]MDF1868708.1 energy transducer TonB [Saprospiraceae bacterium]